MEEEIEAMESEYLKPSSIYLTLSYPSLTSSVLLKSATLSSVSLQKPLSSKLEVVPSSIIIKSIDNYSVSMVTYMYGASSGVGSDNN